MIVTEGVLEKTLPVIRVPVVAQLQRVSSTVGSRLRWAKALLQMAILPRHCGEPASMLVVLTPRKATVMFRFADILFQVSELFILFLSITGDIILTYLFRWTFIIFRRQLQLEEVPPLVDTNA
jgi:hypothetical protein